jgi:hypothetical protein
LLRSLLQRLEASKNPDQMTLKCVRSMIEESNPEYWWKRGESPPEWKP